MSAKNPKHATGTFDVKVVRGDHAPGEALASHKLHKQYRGDIEASSRGEMLSSGGPASGSGGYVALERVTGTLAGRTGTFAIMQFGTLDKGSTHMTVLVVPGSGTGELEGLAGTMTITIGGGDHSCDLTYSL